MKKRSLRVASTRLSECCSISQKSLKTCKRSRLSTALRSILSLYRLNLTAKQRKEKEQKRLMFEAAKSKAKQEATMEYEDKLRKIQEVYRTVRIVFAS